MIIEQKDTTDHFKEIIEMIRYQNDNFDELLRLMKLSKIVRQSYPNCEGCTESSKIDGKCTINKDDECNLKYLLHRVYLALNIGLCKDDIIPRINEVRKEIVRLGL